MILAGDIGGTSSRLALFEEPSRPILEDRFPSRDYHGLDEIVRAFVTANPQPITQVCFGIAGPVRNGRVQTPNLPWVVDAARLARELSVPVVHLINDLEANAYGALALTKDDLAVLNPGVGHAQGNRAVISAGTGLGEAGIFWDGRRYHPFACEGGHSDLAPRDALEGELLLYLRKRLDHVSFERVVSGPGVVNLYEFLRDTGRGRERPELRDAVKADNAAAVIAEAGLAGRCEICVQALDLFVSFYGAEAGNLALKVMATGGVYLGGGIAPKLLAKLREPAFLNAFFAKGRMRPLLEAMPVWVILNEQTALLGAARYAALQGAG